MFHYISSISHHVLIFWWLYTLHHHLHLKHTQKWCNLYNSLKKAGHTHTHTPKTSNRGWWVHETYRLNLPKQRTIAIQIAIPEKIETCFQEVILMIFPGFPIFFWSIWGFRYTKKTPWACSNPQALQSPGLPTFDESSTGCPANATQMPPMPLKKLVWTWLEVEFARKILGKQR